MMLPRSATIFLWSFVKEAERLLLCDNLFYE